jgi:predicted nucleotidyltransferase
LNSAEAKYLKINFNEVLDELRKYASDKSKDHGTKAIILFGSLAKGTYTGTSDADILIIADDVPAKFLDRYTLFASASLSLDVEPRVYTAEEFSGMISHRDFIAIDALKNGIPLFGEQYLKNLKSKHSIG